MRGLILLVFTTLLSLISYNVYTNAGGPVTGVAGEPPFDETCAAAGCHTGSGLNSGGGTTGIECNDSLGNSVTSYIPNHSYTITVSVSEGVKTRYGFEAIVLKGLGTLANAIGTISLIDATKTQLFGGSLKYVMHKSTGIEFPGKSASWTFNWKAPAANNGTATVYVAFNATNSNNAVSGDKVYTKTLDLLGTGTFVGITKDVSSTEQVLFPNPANAAITVRVREMSLLEIYNLEGELVTQIPDYTGQQITGIKDLPAGVYMIKVATKSNLNVYKLIKQ